MTSKWVSIKGNASKLTTSGNIGLSINILDFPFFEAIGENIIVEDD